MLGQSIRDEEYISEVLSHQGWFRAVPSASGTLRKTAIVPCHCLPVGPKHELAQMQRQAPATGWGSLLLLYCHFFRLQSPANRSRRCKLAVRFTAYNAGRAHDVVGWQGCCNSCCIHSLLCAQNVMTIVSLMILTQE